MPVRYDIAASIPQYGGGGGYDPVNMMAQLQSMDYRQQQNALAQMQMQKMQRELQMQNALSGVVGAPGFDYRAPGAPNAVIRTGNISEGLALATAQRQVAALRAQEEAQRATEIGRAHV